MTSRPRSLRALTTLCMAAGLVVAACGSSPRTPEWALVARDGSEAGGLAHLGGQSRLAQVHWQRAADAAVRTGDAVPIARVALAQCAVRLASLEPTDTACAQANHWLGRAADMDTRLDQVDALRFYALYLQGLWRADLPAGVLPAAQQVVAAWLVRAAALGQGHGAVADAQAVEQLNAVPDPLSRLVAASAIWRTGRAGPGVMTVAVETASAQGWVRPLLAWLGLQAQWADGAGQPELARRLRERMAWVQTAAPNPNPTPANQASAPRQGTDAALTKPARAPVPAAD